MFTCESLNVIYSDKSLLVVDKPGGLLTTPAHGEISLIDLLNQRFFGRFQLFVVHRLDRGTSGLLVFARTPSVATHLSRQFAKHSTEREYVAIVKGFVSNPRGTVEIDVNGKKAKTHYEILERLKTTTILRLRLQTGRRNQIRYHVSVLGFPVVGDIRIGGEQARDVGWRTMRIALHAKSLGFYHPVLRSELRFESQLPPEMLDFIDFEKTR